jgi:hypothetical protein
MKRSVVFVRRFEMRCTPSEYKRWKFRAKQLGLPSVATFMRLAANEAVNKAMQESR